MNEETKIALTDEELGKVTGGIFPLGFPSPIIVYGGGLVTSVGGPVGYTDESPAIINLPPPSEE